jgi:hypothetical protein
MTTPAGLDRQHTLATAVARYDQLRMRGPLAPPGLAPDPAVARRPHRCRSRKPWNCSR